MDIKVSRQPRNRRKRKNMTKEEENMEMKNEMSSEFSEGRLALVGFNPYPHLKGNLHLVNDRIRICISSAVLTTSLQFFPPWQSSSVVEQANKKKRVK
jgi:hypothetical protein